jgi:hypothetical protein
MSAAGNLTTTSSGTSSQVAFFPRPAQVVRPTPRSSAVPVRHGPVPASNVPSPNVARLLPEYARPQVGAGRTSTLVSRAPPASRVPPIGITPSGSASGPDMREASRHRIQSHPRKMVTTVGQRRSVIAPSMMVTQPAAPPPELPRAPPVQQPTTRSSTQNSSSVPPQGTSSSWSHVSSPPEAQDKPKVRTAPAAAPAVPTAASAAPPAMPPGTAPSTCVGDTTSVPAPTILERGPRISNTDGVTGRSRQSTIVPEQAAPRHAGRSSVLSPVYPEQSAPSSSPSRSSSTPTASKVRAKDLINRHKPQAANDARPPSMAQTARTPTSSKSPTTVTSQYSPTQPDLNRVDSGIGIWDYSPLEARIDCQGGSSISGNGDRKGLADGAAASMHPTRLPTVLEKKGSRHSLADQESRMSISKSSKHPFSTPSQLSSPPEPVLASPPNTTDSASTPPARGGGAFLTRKPQGSFQTSYQETSTPPRPSTPSSMTHASTTATSTQATLVTPASSFPNLSSLVSKAEPKSWFRMNVLDPFKSRIGLASA